MTTNGGNDLRIKGEVDRIQRQGFGQLGFHLASEDLEILHTEGVRLLNSNVRPWSDRPVREREVYRQPTYVTDDWKVLTNPLGLSEKFDECFSRVFGGRELREKLVPLLGKDYKISNIAIRESLSGDKGIDLHIDGIGEVGFWVLLNNQTTADGTTFVMAKSHRWDLTPV